MEDFKIIAVREKQIRKLQSRWQSLESNPYASSNDSKDPDYENSSSEEEQKEDRPDGEQGYEEHDSEKDEADGENTDSDQENSSEEDENDNRGVVVNKSEREKNTYENIIWSPVPENFKPKFDILLERDCTIHESIGRNSSKLDIFRKLLPYNKPDDAGKTYYVDPLIECLKNTFQKYREDSCRQSIDESMTGFKGRSSLKQYMPMKPVKRGIKMWVRCDSCIGYTYDMNVYTGAESAAQVGTLGERVVLKWAETIKVPDVAICFDRYFSSVKLFKGIKFPAVDLAEEMAEYGRKITKKKCKIRSSGRPSKKSKQLRDVGGHLPIIGQVRRRCARQNNITADNIYIVDESGFSTMMKENQRGKRSARIVASGERTNTTMVCCASAIGCDTTVQTIYSDEIVDAVAQSLKKTAPGPDDIQWVHFRQLSARSLSALKALYNECLRRQYIPAAWKVATAKRGKTDSSGYHNSLLRHKALEAIKTELETTYKQEFCVEDISKQINNIRSQESAAK
ncbi:hypothetical protein CBL_10562 [Carabus blaptoides fortunei]